MILLIGILGHFFLRHASCFTDLDDILKKGEITLITQNNAHCFYIYREQPMGFEYDLAKAFANDLGVTLKVRVARSWKEMVALLETGQGDFIASGILPSADCRQSVRFSDEYLSIRHHIITHRNNSDIQHIEDLNGRTVLVEKDSIYHKKLARLQKQGISLRIEPVENIPIEMLLKKIADRQADVTIADRDIALLNRRYYPQIKVADPIDEAGSFKWAVHPYSRKLRFRINDFFRQTKNNGLITKIHTQYYAHLGHFDYVDLMRYHRSVEKRLPRYINIIKEAAECYGFDWRLIAAQIYQESHFNPLAKSYAGAQGLMQLTHSTARSHDVVDILDPRQNIFAGVKHLRYLYDLYKDASARDRLFLALAAYNVGQGHIQDAQKLAVRMALDPKKWTSLKRVLPLLQNPEYYKGLRYGYCQGSQALNYIRQIMIYYDILKYKGMAQEKRERAANKLVAQNTSVYCATP